MISDDELRQAHEETMDNPRRPSNNSQICSQCAGTHHASQPCPDEGAGDEDDGEDNPSGEEDCKACGCDEQECDLCDGCDGCNCCCECEEEGGEE